MNTIVQTEWIEALLNNGWTQEIVGGLVLTALIPLFVFTRGGLAEFWETRIRRSAQDQLEERIDSRGTIDVSLPEITSRFATSLTDLEDVLKIRRSFFGGDIISPSSTYQDCHSKNNMTFKIVAYDHSSMAYWGMMPTTRQSFEAFCRGDLTHAQMLSEHCVPWGDVDLTGIYLYVIGAVTPFRSADNRPLNRIDRGAVSSILLEDVFAFVGELTKKYTIAGIVGYPSREKGRRWFDTVQGLDIVKGVMIDGNEAQMVYAADATGMTRIVDYLRHRKKFLVTPTWNREQRLWFFKRIGRRSA